MIKEGKKRFAYAVGMFPNPKNGKAAYLDGCILAALGLKRQKTNADVICFITHDISKSDKQKLEVVFDMRDLIIATLVAIPVLHLLAFKSLLLSAQLVL